MTLRYQPDRGSQLRRPAATTQTTFLQKGMTAGGGRDCGGLSRAKSRGCVHARSGKFKKSPRPKKVQDRSGRFLACPKTDGRARCPGSPGTTRRSEERRVG